MLPCLKRLFGVGDKLCDRLHKFTVWVWRNVSGRCFCLSLRAALLIFSVGGIEVFGFPPMDVSLESHDGFFVSTRSGLDNSGSGSSVTEFRHQVRKGGTEVPAGNTVIALSREQRSEIDAHKREDRRDNVMDETRYYNTHIFPLLVVGFFVISVGMGAYISRP